MGKNPLEGLWEVKSFPLSLFKKFILSDEGIYLQKKVWGEKTLRIYPSWPLSLTSGETQEGSGCLTISWWVSQFVWEKDTKAAYLGKLFILANTEKGLEATCVALSGDHNYRSQMTQKKLQHRPFRSKHGVLVSLGCCNIMSLTGQLKLQTLANHSPRAHESTTRGSTVRFWRPLRSWLQLAVCSQCPCSRGRKSVLGSLLTRALIPSWGSPSSWPHLP